MSSESIGVTTTTPRSTAGGALRQRAVRATAWLPSAPGTGIWSYTVCQIISPLNRSRAAIVPSWVSAITRSPTTTSGGAHNSRSVRPNMFSDRGPLASWVDH